MAGLPTGRIRRALAGGAAALLAITAGASEVEVGVGWVADDAWRYGNYSGLEERGLYVIGNADLEVAADDGARWRLQGTDLGLRTRALGIAGGKAGLYDLRLAYAQIPSRLYAIDDSPVAIGSDRETLDLGLRIEPGIRLSYDLDYRYTERDGTALLAGSFLNQSAEIARPLHDETHNLEAGVSYLADSWQARLGYSGSFFAASADALRWQNPYEPVTPGAAAGQLALEPDNEFHQLTVSGQYRWSPSTQVSGRLAVGRLTQDEDLLAFTLNPNLAAPLPRTSADAEVDTLHADLRLASRLSPALRVRATWAYDDRDNDTPIATWEYVVTDAAPGPAARDNPRYGYSRERLEFGADYRFKPGLSGAAGYEHGVVERDQAEVRRVSEDKLWTRLQMALGSAADLRLRYGYSDRDIGEYQPVPGIPAENPLLRKYNMADREQGAVELGLDLRPRDNVDVAFTAELRADDYSESVVGLQSARQKILNVDGSLLLPARSALGATLGYESIRSRQAGSQSFGAPDWSARNDDDTRFAMLSLDLPELLEHWRFRLAYTRVITEGDIEISQSGFAAPFPELETRMSRVEFRARYQARERWSVLFRYAYEDYGVQDWSRDGVLPDTLPRVLTLGEWWRDYSTHVVSLSASYRLGD